VKTRDVTCRIRALRCAAFLILSLIDVLAPAAPTLPDAYRRVFEQGAANGAYGVLAVGLIKDKERQLWWFGKAAGGSAPDAERVFEIGAVSDVFAGVLLGQAVLDGKLRLTEPVRSGFAADFPWGSRELGDTAVVDLATQRSGLPETPGNLFPASSADPYARYEQADLLAFLANYSPPSPHAVAYSALNAALLGVVLSRAYATDYPRLLADKLLTPLGLGHTGFDDPPSLLGGHAFGAAVEHWHYSALGPAAGLRSSAEDLLKFVGANLSPESVPVRAALLLARQSRAQTADGGLGLGWSVHEVSADEQTWPLVWRASETGGFSAFIGFRTDLQEGVVLLADAAIELAPIGLAWMTGLAPPPAPAAPYVADAEVLERYPGLYRLLDGSDLVVRNAGAALVAQLRGQPPTPLVALGEDVFAVRGGGYGITFVRNIDAISGLVLNAGGQFVGAQRLSERAPRLLRNPIELPAARLADYRGDFVLETGVMLRVSVGGDAILAQFTGAAPIPMRAFAPDRFADADGANGLDFHRNEQGIVDGVGADLGGGERKGRPANWRVPPASAYCASGSTCAEAR
jgi:CubicO group peptidase (beta-lactamase class C family)